jgi:poly(A) polymerase
VLHRLRCSTAAIEQVEALIGNHMRFADAPRMRESTLKRFLRQPHFDQHLELHRIDCLSAAGRLENYHFVRRKLAELSEEQIRPAPLLRGDDLIAAGYEPGPLFSRILAAVEDAQLEGRIATPEEAMALVEAEFGPPA